MALRVNADSFPQEVLAHEGTVLVDFYSDSCIPCKRMSPLLTELENTYADRLKVVKVNINFDAELTEQYEVQAAPTLIFFKDGKETSRLRGAVKKEELFTAVEANIE